jgi:hypothetical protein
MKIIIFIPIFMFAILPSFAQKPVAGDKQAVLAFQGTDAGYIMMKSYYKNDKARRYAFGGNGFSYSNTPSSTSNGYKTKNNYFSFNSYLSYGIQKSFNGFEKIEPYIGVDLVLSCALRESYSKREVVDTSITGASTYGDFYLTKASGPSSLRLGLKPVAGFNYYIWKNFAVGIEYSINLFYIGYAIAGSSTVESQIYGLHNIHNYTYGSSFNLGSSFVNSLAVTVNYTFANKKKKKESIINEKPGE